MQSLQEKEKNEGLFRATVLFWSHNGQCMQQVQKEHWGKKEKTKMYSFKKNNTKQKHVAGENALHLSTQVVAPLFELAALARRGAAVARSPLPATAPTLPPAVTHAGDRLNTGERPASRTHAAALSRPTSSSRAPSGRRRAGRLAPSCW